MLCYVMLCYVMLCYVMLCYVMLCYVMLCYVMLCYVMLCYVMLCYVMLCYVKFSIKTLEDLHASFSNLAVFFSFSSSSFLCLRISQGRRRVLKAVFDGEALPRGPHAHPNLFRYHFWTGKVTLSYAFHRKWYPFHMPTAETFSSMFIGSVRDILKGPFKD